MSSPLHHSSPLFTTSPLGVPPDLKSGVKKCPNLFRLCGFAIRSKGYAFPFIGGLQIPYLYRSNLFYGGFQIRRDAWRKKLVIIEGRRPKPDSKEDLASSKKNQGEEWVKSGEELKQLFTRTIISHTTTYTTSVKSEE